MNAAEPSASDMETMQWIAEEMVGLCLNKLIEMGLISLDDVNGKWYVKFDEARLQSKALGGAASLDSTGTPVLYLLPVPDPKGLATVISHEAVHLMQLCKGYLVPMWGFHEWKGRKYLTLPADSPDYFEAQPWEKEALDLQPVLLEVLRTKGFPV